MSKDLEILTKFHKDWINIVKSFGEINYSEDIVQEMYLQVHRYNVEGKIIVNGEINRAYIWIILKNSFLAVQREKTKAFKVPIEEVCYLEYEEESLDKHEAKELIDEKIKEEINNWHFYDKELFNIYLHSGKSMREISRGSKISLSSIFNTIKNCRQRILENVGEDYEDYKNEEYNLIKKEWQREKDELKQK